MRRVALAAAVVLAAAAGGSAARGGQAATTFPASPGHRIAGFSLDRDWLTIAEDATATGACPEVVLIQAPAGKARDLTRPGGASCRFGGRFWVRPGVRAVGNAIVKALWVLRSGSAAEAISSSPSEPEVALVRVAKITAQRGPFLGPVVAQNWLRLFGDTTAFPDGTLAGGAISANDRQLWAAVGAALPVGLDKGEHAVAIGADGSIAIWHAHGAHYGDVADAHALTAAVDDGTVYVLRSDLPQLDVRQLTGALVRSWPVAAGAAPLLDVSGNVAVYIAGRDVHELNVATGADRVVATAPAGSTLLDAQITPSFLGYAYVGGPAGPGRVVVTRR
jgi:hypothetical protein